MKRCTVAFALPTHQWSCELQLEDAATVGDALAKARQAPGAPDLPWDAAVGIFGALCDRSAVPRDGDRIEIYRPLRADPKVSRRERAKAARQGRDQAPSRPRTRS